MTGNVNWCANINPSKAVLCACLHHPGICLHGVMTEQPPAAVTEDLDRLRTVLKWSIPAKADSNLLVGTRNIRALGDFNLDRIGEPLYEAFIATGLWPPTERNTVPEPTSTTTRPGTSTIRSPGSQRRTGHRSCRVWRTTSGPGPLTSSPRSSPVSAAARCLGGSRATTRSGASSLAVRASAVSSDRWPLRLLQVIRCCDCESSPGLIQEYPCPNSLK
ncbi:MAG: hypothetical protein JWO49_2662 [Arthrobacter sp.]|nr:hypothetical protein [Arthrobacter sp.]